MSDIAHLVHFETGPDRLATQGTFSLKVWEPDGHSVKFGKADARLNLVPDRELVVWDRGRSQESTTLGQSKIKHFV